MPRVVSEEQPEDLKQRIKQAMDLRRPRTESLWKGPVVDGVSQSMICRFLVCRERFRIAYVEGLQPFPTLSKPLVYGNMWHICEEYFAMKEDWSKPLTTYSKLLHKQFPTQPDDVSRLERICRTQFPVYVDWWNKNSPVVPKTAIMSESVFSEMYTLPDGRQVKLRGKVDRVDCDKSNSFWLRENKTKSEIDDFKIQRQLRFDLQTMLYLTALMSMRKARKSPFNLQKYRLGGVEYNVVKRPLSGGKHSIVQKKPTKKTPKGESSDAFFKRLGGLIKDNPQDFFARWDVVITEMEVHRFQCEFLNPVLTQILDWWEALNLGDPMKPWEYNGGIGNRHHFRTPYGLYNVLLEGGSTDLDEYIESGTRVGLTTTQKLFPELGSIEEEFSTAP